MIMEMCLEIEVAKPLDDYILAKLINEICNKKNLCSLKLKSPNRLNDQKLINLIDSSLSQCRSLESLQLTLSDKNKTLDVRGIPMKNDLAIQALDQFFKDKQRLLNVQIKSWGNLVLL